MNPAAARWHAPAVLYPVGRRAALAVGCGLLVLAGFVALGFWAVQGAWRHPWWLLGAAGSTWVGAVVLALRFWRALPAGDVYWSGEHWELRCSGRTVSYARVCMHADLQRFLLLRLESADQPPCWLWLERAAQPERWSDLRRAVYSRAQAAAPDAPTSSPPARPGQ